VVYGNEKILSKTITKADISRPVLEMTGYLDYYSPELLQLVVMKEWSYLKTMTDNNRYSVFSNMFKAETPAVIVASGLEIPEEMLQAAKENCGSVLQGRNGTSSLSGDMSWYLNS
nr:HPr kinase/phosphorylase [Streptococcus vestibularis]